MVEDRYNLAHHIFSNIDLNSIEQLSEIDVFFAAQSERILVEHEALSLLVNTHTEYREALSNFVNSDPGNSFMCTLALQQSSLISKMHEISMSSSRADGWTILANAGNELNKALPGNLDEIGPVKF